MYRYAVEVEYDTDTLLDSKKALLPLYSRLQDATGMFNKLSNWRSKNLKM